MFQVLEKMDQDCAKYAPFHVNTFTTGGMAENMKSQKAKRWISKDTYGRLLKHGMISKWSEIPADKDGVLRFKDIVFFNEGFLSFPFFSNLLCTNVKKHGTSS